MRARALLAGRRRLVRGGMSAVARWSARREARACVQAGVSVVTAGVGAGLCSMEGGGAHNLLDGSVHRMCFGGCRVRGEGGKRVLYVGRSGGAELRERTGVEYEKGRNSGQAGMHEGCRGPEVRGGCGWSHAGVCPSGSGCLAGGGGAAIEGGACGAEPVTGWGLWEGRV